MTSLITLPHDATMREKRGLTILSQGATLLRANDPNPAASGQNGQSFFAPSSISRTLDIAKVAGK
jgi:hypothetical protein